jgi:hypothetical protein
VAQQGTDSRGGRLTCSLPLLIVLISLVYSATRFDEWGPILREGFRWGLRLVAFLGAIMLALFLLHKIT